MGAYALCNAVFLDTGPQLPKNCLLMKQVCPLPPTQFATFKPQLLFTLDDLIPTGWGQNPILVSTNIIRVGYDAYLEISAL